MKYAFLIAVREFVENAKTKGFWIGILMFPVILFAAAQVPMLLEKKGTPLRNFVVVDQSGQFSKLIYEAIEQNHDLRVLRALGEYSTVHALSNAPSVYAFGGSASNALVGLQPHLKPDAPKFEPPMRRFRMIALPPGVSSNSPLPELAESLKPFISGNRKFGVDGQQASLFAAVLIPGNAEELVVRGARANPDAQGLEYWSANLADMSLRDEIERVVNSELRRKEFAASGVDPQMVRQIEHTHLPVVSLNPKKTAGSEKVGRQDVIRQWAPSAFVYLLWIAIFSIVQMLLNNTIEEKSNKIIEVLLSSVTPGELMMGKLAGIAATGLAMIGSWLVALVAILLWKAGGQSEIPREMLGVVKTTYLLPAFVVYFVFGYLMYAGIILCIGAVCNTLKESQNFMGAIVMVLMVPMLTMTFIPKDPNGTVATVLSWIPLYTPFIMLN